MQAYPAATGGRRTGPPPARLVSDGGIDYGQDFGGLPLVAMYVVRYDGVVVDAVPLVEDVVVASVGNLHGAFHHEDKLLSLMGGEHEVGIVGRHHVDDEGLHVAVGLRARQGVVDHVLAALNGVVGELDAVEALVLAAHHGAFLLLLIKEGAQTHAQHAGNLDERSQRGQVDVALDTLYLFDADARLAGQFFARESFLFAQRFDFLAYNFVGIHSHYLLLTVMQS